MSDTPNLSLPYILAAQAQKHVTHNEAIRKLDAIVQLSVITRTVLTPPASPIDGDRYIVATGSSGVWSGKDGQMAAYQDNSWNFYTPVEGWIAWVMDEGILLAHNGASWIDTQLNSGTSQVINSAMNGAKTTFKIFEEELSLNGSSIDSGVLIPDRAIVFAVSTHTTETISGAASYDCGVSGETDKYGGSLGASAGSRNSGVTGPTAYYADTPIRLTANGGNFTGGKVRIAAHYMTCSAPTT